MSTHASFRSTRRVRAAGSFVEVGLASFPCQSLSLALLRGQSKTLKTTQLQSCFITRATYTTYMHVDTRRPNKQAYTFAYTREQNVLDLGFIWPAGPPNSISYHIYTRVRTGSSLVLAYVRLGSWNVAVESNQISGPLFFYGR